jgi:hypothetical protein
MNFDTSYVNIERSKCVVDESNWVVRGVARVRA